MQKIMQPSEPKALRAALEEALQAEDRVEGLRLAKLYWQASPDASVARFLKARFDALWPDGPRSVHRLAILRSSTLEPVVPLLEAEAALHGCKLDVWMGAFNAYGQEILDDASELYARGVDAVVVAVETRDVAPLLWREFARLSSAEIDEQIAISADLLIGLLTSLRSKTTARLICHGLEQPASPVRGLLEANAELRQSDAIQEINLRLRRWCANQTDIYLLDYDGLIAQHGRLGWTDERKWVSARLSLTPSAMNRLAAEWWRYLALFALPQAKVLALDLDNTLWGGVLGEDGPEGIQLGNEGKGVFFAEFQRTILDIAERGIMLALVSKNNEAEALELIDSHSGMLVRSSKLAAWRVNWKTKVENLIDLAQELGVGVDSLVFVDDNPVECEAIRRALPEVEVVELPSDPSAYSATLRSVARLERLSLSEEDTSRGRYYVEERQRRDLRTSVESLDAFLSSLKIEVQIEEISSLTVGRAAQLTQKTNQLNMTTKRYSEAELQTLLAGAAWRGFVLRSSDRFGENGIVGIALVKGEGRCWEIDTFLLSCRVIGRGIELALLEHIANAASSDGAAVLEGLYIPTAKNAPAAGIYAAAGFDLVEKSASAERWRVNLAVAAPSAPVWIRRGSPACEPNA